MSCYWCKLAIRELIKYNFIFKFIDTTGKSIAELTGRLVNTIPQIYIEGEYVGGYEDLLVYLRK